MNGVHALLPGATAEVAAKSREPWGSYSNNLVIADTNDQCVHRFHLPDPFTWLWWGWQLPLFVHALTALARRLQVRSVPAAAAVPSPTAVNNHAKCCQAFAGREAGTS